MTSVEVVEKLIKFMKLFGDNESHLIESFKNYFTYLIFWVFLPTVQFIPEEVLSSLLRS